MPVGQKSQTTKERKGGISPHMTAALPQQTVSMMSKVAQCSHPRCFSVTSVFTSCILAKGDRKHVTKAQLFKTTNIYAKQAHQKHAPLLPQQIGNSF